MLVGFCPTAAVEWLRAAIRAGEEMLVKYYTIILEEELRKIRKYQYFSLGGVVVSVLATGPKVAGSNPAEDDGF
jgi:hypothetical protein